MPELYVHTSREYSSMDLILSAQGIFLELLWVDGPHRRKGLGTELMNELCAYADATGQTIILNARSESMTQPDTQAFYARFGFVAGIASIMKRVPQPLPQTEAA